VSLLGITVARIGMVDLGARYCEQARAEVHGMGQPVYAAHAARTHAQALVLAGDYRQAIEVCEEAISLARSYGGIVDVARLEIVAGRARQCSLDYAAAMVSLSAAADVFRDTGLMLDEVTARSMLAACFRSARNDPASDGQVTAVSHVLARNGVTDAESVAAAAERACQRSVDR
jgi:hypothetical protein